MGGLVFWEQHIVNLLTVVVGSHFSSAKIQFSLGFKCVNPHEILWMEEILDQ
jgi:hypothetical protein